MASRQRIETEAAPRDFRSERASAILGLLHGTANVKWVGGSDWSEDDRCGWQDPIHDERASGAGVTDGKVGHWKLEGASGWPRRGTIVPVLERSHLLQCRQWRAGPV